MATVVAGSYERFVFGYDVRDLPSGGGRGGSSGDPSVSRSFTLDAHLGQCKSVAARGSTPHAFHDASDGLHSCSAGP